MSSLINYDSPLDCAFALRRAVQKNLPGMNLICTYQPGGKGGDPKSRQMIAMSLCIDNAGKTLGYLTLRVKHRKESDPEQFSSYAFLPANYDETKIQKYHVDGTEITIDPTGEPINQQVFKAVYRVLVSLYEGIKTL